MMTVRGNKQCLCIDDGAYASNDRALLLFNYNILLAQTLSVHVYI
jgi:hypothetical protein